MAFDLTLYPEDLATLEVQTDGGQHAIHLQVGENPGHCTYHMFASLVPLTAGAGDMEFLFCMLEITPDGGEHQIWDARTVAALAPKEAREIILTALAVMAHKLVETVRPERFTMTVFEPYSPQKALQKYLVLNHVFGSCGYRVTKADPYNGVVGWWLDRLP